jgi:RNA polymerase sigma-70 factor, ECF subfamily
MLSDEELMQRFRAGAREAFTELFARYRESIYAYFRRRMDDSARAEELAQETFVAVIRGAGRYEPRALFRTYLYGIALRLLWNERRRRTTPSATAEETHAGGDLDAALWVRQAVARLDEHEREILMLREYEQLSYEEIAQLLQAPVNTVRSRLFRARMALKEQLLGRREAPVRNSI